MFWNSWGLLEAPGASWNLLQALGSLWRASGQPPGASWKLLGSLQEPPVTSWSFWEASGQPLGGLQEPPGATKSHQCAGAPRPPHKILKKKPVITCRVRGCSFTGLSSGSLISIIESGAICKFVLPPTTCRKTWWCRGWSWRPWGWSCRSRGWSWRS